MSESETFDVVIVGFDDRTELPEARLQRAFGIEPGVAAQLVAGLPSTVQRAVSLVRAEYFRRALTLIGAEVTVRDPAGRTVAPPPPSLPPPPASVRPEAQLPVTSASAAPAAPRPSAPPRRAEGTLREAPFPPAVAQAWPANPEPQLPERLPAAAPGQGPVFPPIEWPPAAPPAPSAPFAAAEAAPGWGWWKGIPEAVGQPTPPAENTSNSNLIGPDWAQLAGAANSAPGWAAPRAPGRPASGRPPAPQEPLLGARVPSDIWDPPPAPKARGARAPAAAAAPAHQHALGQDFGLVSVAPGAAQAPLSLAETAPTPRRHARFDAAPQPLTLEDMRAGEQLPVLGAWEQPNDASMAEPIRSPLSPLPMRPRPSSSAPDAASVGAASLRPPKRARPQQANDLPPHAPRAAMPQPVAERPARPRPAAVAPAASAAERPRPARPPLADMRSFWETVGEAFVLPLRGPGLFWVFAIAVLSVVVSLISLLAGFVPIVGFIVSLFANTCVLAFACDYYRVCFWAPASGEEVIDRGPDFDPARLLNNYMKSGIHLVLFLLASQVLVIAFAAYHFATVGFSMEGLADLATHPVLWLLVLFPYYYWTMGVGLTALTSNFTAIWSLPPGLRAIARAPLEYTFIVFMGMLVLGVSFAALLLFGSMLGATGALLSGAFGIPLALSHGVQGALMGHLLRARPEVFEE